MNHPSPADSPGNPSPANADSTPLGESWQQRYPWAPLVLPLAVYMAVGMFEPTPEKPFELLGLSIEYSSYPVVYSVKLALTMAVLAAAWPAYRQFTGRPSAWGPVVGVVGAAIWIGLCKLHLEGPLFSLVGLGQWADQNQRSAFNPFDHWPDAPGIAWLFLSIRFLGLGAIVPLIEELFLRGFLMRFVIDADWWKVPFGTLTPLAVAAGTLVPILMHPLSEALAVAAWFTLVTVLMFKTRSLWDCVVAHAVTNLLLGIYVVASGDWFLW